MDALVERFSPVVTQTIGMTRAVYDGYEQTIADEPAVRAIAEQLHRAAHDVRLAFALDAGPSASSTKSRPSPVPCRSAHPRRCTGCSWDRS